MSGGLDYEALVAQIRQETEAKVRAEILAQSTLLAPQPAGHGAAGRSGGPAAGGSGGPAAGSSGGPDPDISAHSPAPPSSDASGEVEVISGGSTAKETTARKPHLKWDAAARHMLALQVSSVCARRVG